MPQLELHRDRIPASWKQRAGLGLQSGNTGRTCAQWLGFVEYRGLEGLEARILTLRQVLCPHEQP
jgi:hypothetical protein